MALHHAAEALALRDADDVDLVAGGEDVGLHLLAGRIAARVVGPQLDEVARRLDVRLVEMTLGGSVDRAGAHGSVGELDRVVTVDVLRSDLRDHAGARLQDRDRHGARLDEQLGHAQLLAHDALDVRHLYSLISMSTPADRFRR